MNAVHDAVFLLIGLLDMAAVDLVQRAEEHAFVVGLRGELVVLLLASSSEKDLVRLSPLWQKDNRVESGGGERW